MARASRDKGARGEREVVEIAQRHGFNAQRTFSQIDGDRGDITGITGCCVEVKRQESLNIWAALAQAEAASPTAQIPVVAFRRNGSGWYAALPLDDLLELVNHADLWESGQ